MPPMTTERLPDTDTASDTYALASDLDNLAVVFGVLCGVLFLLLILLAAFTYFLWRKTHLNRWQDKIIRSDIDRLRAEVAALQGRHFEDGRIGRGVSAFSDTPSVVTGVGSPTSPHPPSPPANSGFTPFPPSSATSSLHGLPSPPPSSATSSIHGLPSFQSSSNIPRYSLAFMHKDVDVFEANLSGDVALPEIYMAAQNYYDHEPSLETVRQSVAQGILRKSVKSVTIENIRVVPLYKTTYAHVDRQLPSDAISPSKRPMSIFITPERAAGATADAGPSPPQSMSGMFVSETIGPAGGTVKMHGVSLEIPPGALLAKEEIKLGIVWEAGYQPPMDKKTALLSPVVSCEPHGLQFKKPAKLTLPHCAQADGEASIGDAWTFTILKTETSLGQRPNWTEMSPTDFGTRAITANDVSFTISHFTGYTVTGQTEIGSKVVRLVAFAPPLDPPNFFRITVYCFNEYKDKMVEDEMEQFGAKAADTSKPLRVYDNNNNVRVKLDSVPSGWELEGPLEEDLDFDMVWHAEGPTCSFDLDPVGDQQKIACRVNGYQLGREDKKQVIKISQKKQLKLPTRDTDASLGKVFPPKLCDTIVKLLDPTSLEGRDWRMLADKLQMCWDDVRWLEDRAIKGCERGPTFLLLVEWERRKWTLDEFQKTMTDIGRHDVADDIRVFLQNNRVPPSSSRPGSGTNRPPLVRPKPNSRPNSRPNTGDTTRLKAGVSTNVTSTNQRPNSRNSDDGDNRITEKHDDNVGEEQTSPKEVVVQFDVQQGESGSRQSHL